MKKQVEVIVALVVTGMGIGWLTGLSVSPVISVILTSVVGAAAAVIAVLSGVREEVADRKNSASVIDRWLKRVTPAPVMWLVIGLVAGVCVGLVARNFNWLGPKPFLSSFEREVELWSEQGLDENIVRRRLFDAQYGYRGWVGGDLDTEIEKWVAATGLDPSEIGQRLFESTYPLESVSVATNSSGQQKDALDVIGFTALKSAEARLQTNELCDMVEDNSGSTLREYIGDVITIQQVISLTNAITDDQMLKEAIKVLCPDG